MAQLNNQNARKGTHWRDSVRKALAQYTDGDVKQGEALYRIAYGLVYDAIHGDSAERREARKEIGDRLDGKPVQALSGPEGEPITAIRREIIVMPQDNRIIEATQPETTNIETLSSLVSDENEVGDA